MTITPITANMSLEMMNALNGYNLVEKSNRRSRVSSPQTIEHHPLYDSTNQNQPKLQHSQKENLHPSLGKIIDIEF